jgi:iron(III) transport system substrate-binding protein
MVRSFSWLAERPERADDLGANARPCETLGAPVPSNRTATVVLAASILLVVAGCGDSRKPAVAPANQANNVAQLYAQAKAEGEVDFWGPEDKDEINSLAATFNQKYPGIKVVDYEIEAGDMMPKIITGARAGNPGLDAGEGGLGDVAQLLDRNLVQDHTNWGGLLPLPQDAQLQNGKLLAWYNILHPIGYNTNLVSAADAPKTWNDLLDPKWKGKIIIEPRAKSFQYMGVSLGEQGLVDYMKKLKAQNPIYVNGGSTVVQQLAAGVAPIAVGMYSYQIDQLRDQKHAPIDWTAPSPIGADQNVVFTVVGAKHPAAAQLWVDWLASDEGLTAQRTLDGKGSILEGPDADTVKQANATLVVETEQNTDQLAKLEKAAADALGVVKSG